MNLLLIGIFSLWETLHSNFQVQNYEKILRWTRLYVKEHNCRTSVKQTSRFDKVKHHRVAVTPLDGVEV